ncbi:MAG: hypothetical protein IKR40_08670 [Treponema sp.]|nr:hypothetical protein [Treponema sp.]
MKKLLSILLITFTALTLHAQTVAVLGFESDNFCIEDKTGTMSDLLTDELVNIPHITVVERKYIDKLKDEMKFQASPYTDPTTAKSLGKMIGADCVIIGTADVFNCTLTVTARTIEVETGKILYSTKMTCDTWGEFNQKLPDFARNLVSKIPVPDRFEGTWYGIIENGEYSDEYTITFAKKGKCAIDIVPDGDFDATTISAVGTWSDNDDILRITAKFRTDIARLKNLKWTAVYLLDDSGNMFSMNLPLGEGGKLVRVMFTKQ